MSQIAYVVPYAEGTWSDEAPVLASIACSCHEAWQSMARLSPVAVITKPLEEK